MKQILALLLSGSLPLGSLACMDSAGAAQRAEAAQGFAIVFGPHARADTFLLDTATGKVWQMVKYTNVEGEPIVWEPMARIDTEEQRADWALDKTPKAE